MSYNFTIPVIDTDSLTICKLDGTEFSQDEINKLTEEINKLTDELIIWEFEFYIPKLIVVKSKNYILDYGNGKIKTKGSSIRDQKKEPACRELMDEIIKAMLEDRHSELVNIYHKYIKEALNVKDINRWSTKKTITQSITNCKGYTQADIKSKKLRKNETDVWDAVKNEDSVSQGDKVYLYSKLLKTITIPGGVSEKTGKPLKDKEENIYGLEQSKNWKNDHDVESLIDRCFATLKIFKEVLDIEKFVDYTKKKNKEKLQELINEAV